MLVKCIPIPDKKNKSRYILKIIEPKELKGKIAFPIDFEPKPFVRKDFVVDSFDYQDYYLCEIVYNAEKWCRVKLHRCEFETEYEWYEVNTTEKGYALVKYQKAKCRKCGKFEIKKNIVKEIELKENEPLPYLTNEEDVEKLIKFVNEVEEFAKKNNIEVRFLESIKSWIPILQRILEMKKEKDKVIEFLRDLFKEIELVRKYEEIWTKWVREKGLKFCLKCGIVHDYKIEEDCYEICVEWDEYRSSYFGESDSWFFSRDIRVCKRKERRCYTVYKCSKCEETVVNYVVFSKVDKLITKIEDRLRFNEAWKVFFSKICNFKITTEYGYSIFIQLRNYLLNTK